MNLFSYEFDIQMSNNFSAFIVHERNVCKMFLCFITCTQEWMRHSNLITSLNDVYCVIKFLSHICVHSQRIKSERTKKKNQNAEINTKPGGELDIQCFRTCVFSFMQQTPSTRGSKPSLRKSRHFPFTNICYSYFFTVLKCMLCEW